MTNSNRVEHASETWLTDATVFEVNRTPAHSNHKCFTHDPQKPYISCEYMHTMGNSVGNLDEYTALERYPHYQGRLHLGLHRSGDLCHPAGRLHPSVLWRRLRRSPE